MLALLSRILSSIVLLATLAWIVVPVAAFAAPKASHVEGEACPCCDGPATVGPIAACPGCLVAAPSEGGLRLPDRTSSAAWNAVMAVRVAGLDTAPAEPPPR
ncbi:MAG: hypothetical protein ACK4JB_02875 [Reyranella sp.]